MSLNKFTNQGKIGAGLHIESASITSSNLLPLLPVKTDATSTIISTKLDITDINNLQEQLNMLVVNPLTTSLNCLGNNIYNIGQNLTDFTLFQNTVSDKIQNITSSPLFTTVVGNIDSNTRSESTTPGELIKNKNTYSYYAGLNSASSLTTGSGDVLIGRNTGSALSVQIDNSAVGDNAIRYQKGNYNTAFGANSQLGNPTGTNTGERNVSIGWGSLYNIDTGSYNSCIGHSAGFGLKTTSNNTCVGYQSNDDPITDSTSTNCVALGSNSKTNGDNQISIGYLAKATKPNQCTIGNASLLEIVSSSSNLCSIGSSTRPFKELFVTAVNGSTPYGGVFMTVSNASLFSGQTETSLFSGSTNIGSLTIAPNTFQIGAYQFNLSGTFASNNGDTLIIRLKSSGVILGTFIVQLNSTSGQFFEFKDIISVRRLGIAGSAELANNFEFTYSDTVQYLKGNRSCVVNASNFNTTISNVLDITAQFSSGSIANKIQTLQAIFTRLY